MTENWNTVFLEKWSGTGIMKMYIVNYQNVVILYSISEAYYDDDDPLIYRSKKKNIDYIECSNTVGDV
jgi:hypothetical protein